MPIVRLSRREQQIPGAIVFFRANPDIEIRINPRSGDNVTDGPSLIFRESLGNRERFQMRIVGDALVQLTQEWAALLPVPLPCILTIENDRHQHVAELRVLADTIEEM